MAKTKKDRGAVFRRNAEGISSGIEKIPIDKKKTAERSSGISDIDLTKALPHAAALSSLRETADRMTQLSFPPIYGYEEIPH